MSKNIVIQEGGVGFQFTADKLKTNLVGGGTCLWGLQEETVLTTKTITKDGTYKASTDGYYGYSQVTVKGVGSATGKMQDGNEYYSHTDGSGNLSVEKIPSSIVVTTPPTVTAYNDGATILFDGIVVTAYDGNGNSMGTVPFNELVFSETIADYDEAEGYGAASELETGLAQPIYADTTGWATGNNGGSTEVTHYYSGAMFTMWRVGNDLLRVAASLTQGDTFIAELPESGTTHRYSLNQTYTYQDLTVYYAYDSSGTGWRSISDFSPEAHLTGSANHGAIAWTLIYGLITGALTVHVEWARPGDGATLKTSFYVYVFPRSDD